MKNRHTKTPLVVGIGEILWDMLPEGKRLGGAPANFAFHSHTLGARAIILSALGRDEAGSEIRRQLSSQKLCTDHLHTSDRPTGWVDVDISQDGLPRYIIHENVAWDFISLSSQAKDVAPQCDAVCFGSLAQRNPVSRQTILDFLDNTSKDCLRVFDINLRQDYFSGEILHRSLQAANALKLNDDELVVLQDLFELPQSQESALKTLMDRYTLDLIACTMGPAGSLMIDQTNSCHCDGIPVTIKDTIGAGDSFTATMVMGRLNGLPLETINRLAGKVAAYVCSQLGATPSLPDELISELSEEMPILIQNTEHKCQSE